MARGPSTFKQQDVTRALRATVAAGIDVQRVEIGRDGKIIIVAGKPMQEGEKPVDQGRANEWDAV